MPSNSRGRRVPPSVLRRRGLKRLSAVTAGVGVASVVATGAVAAALPGSSHHSATAGTGGTGSGAASAGSGSSGSGSGSESSGGSGSAFSPATSPNASSGGADATSGAS